MFIIRYLTLSTIQVFLYFPLIFRLHSLLTLITLLKLSLYFNSLICNTVRVVSLILNLTGCQITVIQSAK